MTDQLDEWAIVELMGHRRLAGHVSEQEIAGQAFLRLDVPADPPVTQFYSASAVYCITPTTEEIARAVGARTAPAPVHRFELEAARAEPEQDDEDQDDEDDYDYYQHSAP